MFKRVTLFLCILLISNLMIGDDVMALTRPTWPTNTIQSLANQVTGQAPLVKAAFDKQALDNKTYTSNLCDEIEEQFATKTELQNTVLGQIPAETIIDEKLVKATKSSSIDTNPSLVNMHFEALKGTGWVGEPTSIDAYPITAISLKGTKVISCDNPSTKFTASQLICYKGTDSQYYSNIVTAFGTNTINLAYPLEVDVDTTGTVMHFYSNYAHPNKWGYYTICDYALREMNKTGELVYKFVPNDYSTIASNVSFSSTSRDLTNYGEPFGIFDTKIAAITAQNDGIQKTFTIKKPGSYKIAINLNTISDNTIKINIVDAVSSTVVASKILNNSNYSSSEKMYMNLEEGRYKIQIVSLSSSGTTYIYMGKTEIYFINKKFDYSQLNKGVHLLLGDSWFDNTYFIERMKELLPNATIINYGVGGNKMENVINRFIGTATDTDIANNPTLYGDRKDATKIDKIDYVWVMCSTNDYYTNKTAALYQSQMKTLINYITGINAKPIVFTASVGDKNDTAATGYQLYNLSRQYADFNVNLNSYKGIQHIVVNFSNVSVPNNTDTALGIAGVVRSNQNTYIEEVCFDYETNKNLAVTFQGGITGAGPINKTQLFTTGYTFTSETDFGSWATDQFLGVVAKNTTGSTKTYTGYVKFRIE